MRHPKRLLNQHANLAQQFFQIENRRGLLRDRVDRLQLPGPLPLQRIQAGVLQRDRGLCRKQR